MTDQNTYDRTLDAPPAQPAAGGAATALPNEEYYRQPPAQRPAKRNAGLGTLLIVAGLLLLAFQVFGRGVSIGPGGTYTLIDDQLAGNRIELSVAASDVEIHTWNGSEIKIEAIQRGGSRGDYSIDIDASGDTVRVIESNRSLWCFFCSRSLHYRIDVPEGAEAEIQTASGDIEIDGLSGAVTLTTVSGDVRAEELRGGLSVSTTSGEVQLNAIEGALNVGTISGDIRLDAGRIAGATIESTSGSVNLEGVDGALLISTVSGDIGVRDARDGRLTFTTTSGDIEYQGELADGAEHNLNTISGDVLLRLPAAESFRIDASTVSGEVVTDFPLSATQDSQRSVQGQVGDDSGQLTISTTSGSIRVEQQ